MKINKNNYEQFLIDFMDGNLDTVMEKALKEFLNQHPEIKKEFDDFECINIVVDDKTTFNFKNDLKKPEICSTENIHINNYEEYFIASNENDLNNEQQTELNLFISRNPNLKKTYQLYNISKVEADQSITYDKKKSLKKYVFVKSPIWYYGAAASILLLVGMFFFPLQNNKQVLTARTQIKIPQKLNQIRTATVFINSSDANIILQSKTINIDLAYLDIQEMPELKIQKLNLIFSNTQLLALSIPKPNKPGLLFYRFDYIKTPIYNQVYYASNDVNEFDGQMKKVSLLKKIFSKMSKKKRKPEGGSEFNSSKRVSPLWAIANIGLDRINTLTGTNMYIPPASNKKSEGKYYQELDEGENDYSGFD